LKDPVLTICVQQVVYYRTTVLKIGSNLGRRVKSSPNDDNGIHESCHHWDERRTKEPNEERHLVDPMIEDLQQAAMNDAEYQELIKEIQRGFPEFDKSITVYQAV